MIDINQSYCMLQLNPTIAFSTSIHALWGSYLAKHLPMFNVQNNISELIKRDNYHFNQIL